MNPEDDLPINIGSVERHPDLDTGERQLLVDLMTSPAWKVLVEKVWRWQLHNLLRVILSTKDDVELKGEYHGLQAARQLAEKFATADLNFAMGVGISEAGLMARKRVTRQESTRV